MRNAATLPVRRSAGNPYTFTPSEARPTDAFRSARLMAAAWAREMTDKRRMIAGRLFIADAIKTFAAVFADRHGLQTISHTLRPEALLIGALDRTAAQLAATLGEEVAALDPVSAAYWLSATYTAMLPDDMRSLLGIYYTPPALSQRLMDMTEEAGVDWATARVLDPACGGGAFLAPVAGRMLAASSDMAPADLLASISRRVCGFEIDPFAAWMSQVFLEITMSRVCRAAGQPLPQLVTVCDSLEQKAAGDFDLVIGNPPYGRTKLKPAMREKFSRSLYGHANLYGIFTDLAVRWSVPGGVIAYVTPTSFLAGEYFKKLRVLLAAEAPPLAVDFIADRKDVFENVLQETMLATYRTGGRARKATVHHLTVSSDLAAITQAGAFELPADASRPWLLPRQPENKSLVARLTAMPTRFADWGYTISTGPLVWNRYKDQLRSRPTKGAVPLIWAEAVAGPGRFIYRAEKRNHEPFFKLQDGEDDWLKTTKPCVLIQRTTAKEQSRRLIAATLPAELIAAHGAVVVENHLNMVRPLNGKPKVSPEVVAAILNSHVADRAFRCISGSVAVSAFELEALPLPSVEGAVAIDKLLRVGSSAEVIENALQALYMGEAH